MPSVRTSALGVRFRQRSGWWAKPVPVEALANVDLTAEPGQVVGILGPNGSGKTTLLRVLSGEQLPSAGTAEVLGLPPTDRRLARRVGYQPQGRLPFPGLAAIDLLDYVGAVLGESKRASRERARALIARVGLERVGHRSHGVFSTGMARRLAIATALVSDPEVVLLDEPTSGLDPDGSLIVLELVAELRERKRTVFLASHHLREVEELCDHVHVFVDGRCCRSGTLDELLQTDEAEVVVRGLDSAELADLAAEAERRGAEVVHHGPRRGHLEPVVRALSRADHVATAGQAQGRADSAPAKPSDP